MIPHQKTLTFQVFLITGSSSGIGKELAQILYSKDAKVYVAARSEVKANVAIEAIKVAVPKSKGSLIFLHLDLDDLSGIKKSANEFLSKESRLDVLFNNAGVMISPQGSKTKQGYELQLGTNCLAPFLFTQLLTPILKQTAKIAPPGTVRVVWTSSSAAELVAPKNGVVMDNLDYRLDQTPFHKYGVSKAGNFYHATEYAKRHKADGIISMVRLCCATRFKRTLLMACVPAFEPRKSQERPHALHAYLAKDCNILDAARSYSGSVYFAVRWSLTGYHNGDNWTLE